MPGVDSPIPPQNAVSVYSQDAMDDFPVLKAFQQYIDAEQAKARKRILSLGIFFGILTGAIIAVFVILLLNMSVRNQQLNDRILEFVMKDRDRQPVVVQPAPQPDASSLVASLVAKLDAMQSKIAEEQAKKVEESLKRAQEAPPAAAPGRKTPSSEQLEIERLRAQLAAEREKAAVEKERRRQEELEAYRRKHYPELYRTPAEAKESRRAAPAPANKRRVDPADEEIEKILKEADVDEAISYFDDDEAEPKQKASAPKPAATPKASAPKTSATPKAPAMEKQPAQGKDAEPAPAAAPAPQAQEPSYTIPVDVKKPKRSWRIPPE